MCDAGWSVICYLISCICHISIIWSYRRYWTFFNWIYCEMCVYNDHLCLGKIPFCYALYAIAIHHASGTLYHFAFLLSPPIIPFTVFTKPFVIWERHKKDNWVWATTNASDNNIDCSPSRTTETRLEIKRVPRVRWTKQWWCSQGCCFPRPGSAPCHQLHPLPSRQW